MSRKRSSQRPGADILPQLADLDWETRHVSRPEAVIRTSRKSIPLHILGDRDGIEVRESTLAGLGNGLFAAKDFEKGEYVTGYSGLIISHEQATELSRLGLGSHIRSVWLMQTAIYGHKQPHNGYYGGSFVNHHARESNVAFANLDVNDGCERHVVLRTTRPVFAGEEFFVDYGRGYFSMHGIEDATL